MQTVEKPWGYEVWWAVTERYVGKLIHVNQGHSLSLQYHVQKHESMYVIQGEAELLLGEETRRLKPGDAVMIAPPTRHRLTAITDVDVIEVSTPELDDVVRLEDRYGREGTSTP
ncbi:Cupin 2 conserved barrel domain protein [Sulfobacillus acidophilus DSM 10332]|uniref:Cupin 2 conserved barrel domain protein n=1 Tax=Sulfobacillus acidophilus (strain ATCC 700253 / DSM 10332 / NAL) TaxID=679936 RepID=G8TZM6_SULAD|nr:Cupin 2 conserved barrel domain protein [Sulfobacillus acidophilus DSM 10332]